MDAGEQKAKNRGFSLDWLVQGVLTKLGDTFDRLTGRGWNPSSSLATSKLVEKLKTLLDAEVKDLGDKGKFVPHNLRLMIQWDKFSTDSEDDLEKLAFELHAAAIDHINDKLYHTYDPIVIEIKTDYFTEGVRLMGSFGKFSENDVDEASINVTLPNLRTENLITDNKISVVLNEEEVRQNLSTFIATFNAGGKQRQIELDFSAKKRVSVGRSKENDLFIEDKSVSKIHASLALDSGGQLVVADTGSSNGTFVDERRIAYGKAVMIGDGIRVKFGDAEVDFRRVGELLDNRRSEGKDSDAHIFETVSEVENVHSPDSEPPETVADIAVSVNNEEVSGSDNDGDLESEREVAPNDRVSSAETNDKDRSSELPKIDETQDWEI